MEVKSTARHISLSAAKADYFFIQSKNRKDSSKVKPVRAPLPLQGGFFVLLCAALIILRMALFFMNVWPHVSGEPCGVFLKNAFLRKMSFCGGSYLSLPSPLNVIGKSVDCFPQVFRRCKATGSMLDTVDASSMLCRLEMEGKKRADMSILRGPTGAGVTVCIKDDEKEAQGAMIVQYCQSQVVLDLPQCAKFPEHADEHEESAATFVSVLLNGVKAPVQLLIWDDLR